MNKKYAMRNSIVKFNNEFNKVPLSNFSGTEIDILFSIFQKTKDQDSRKIKMDFEELKKLSGYQLKDYRFIEDLSKFNKKLLALNFTLYLGPKIMMGNVFNDFTVDTDTKELEVSIHESFRYILNDMTDNFTRFELKELIGIKSKHMKNLYRLLKQYRTTGYMRISTDELKKTFGLSDKYLVKDMNKNFLNEERLSQIKPYFKKLKINKVIKPGSRKIIAYEFIFTPEKVQQEIKHIEKQDKKSKDKPIGFECPSCGGKLVERNINGDIVICHSDGHLKTSKCHKIYRSVAEVRGFSENPKRDTYKPTSKPKPEPMPDDMRIHFQELLGKRA